MNINFKELPWHDSILESLNIDRTNPGENDIIQLNVIWPLERYSQRLQFNECYAIDMQMNFGIIASETILTADCLTQSAALENIRNLWSKTGVDLSKLIQYQLVTNSTNSFINIFAMEFKIINHYLDIPDPE